LRFAITRLIQASSRLWHSFQFRAVVLRFKSSGRPFLERHTAGARDLNGEIGPLFRTDSAEEREIPFPRLKCRPVQIDGHAVMDRCHKIRDRQRPALSSRDCNQRHVVDRPIERSQIGNVQAAVKGRDGPRRDRAEDWEMQLIDMEMQNVELVRPLPHIFEHEDVVREGIANRSIEPQCAGRARHQVA
jgi:hypothetical protein